MRAWPTMVIAACLAGATATAADRALAVGVFLPTSMADGKQRFAFAEALAQELATALNRSVVGRNFARYEDFSKAVGDGSLDLAVVDAWVLAESSLKGTPLSTASEGGQISQRWAVVARTGLAVKDLAGKRLALAKGFSAPQDAKFVGNVIFMGDLSARHFKWVSVPSVESALKAVEVRSAEAALVPLTHATDELRVIYKSGRVLGPIVLSLKGDTAEHQTALSKLAPLKPFDKFTPLTGDEVGELRRLISKGPAPRLPVVAESPLLRVSATAIIDQRGLKLILPAFAEMLEPSIEKPDP